MQTVVHCDNTSLFTGWLLTGSVIAFVATIKETSVNTGFYYRSLLLSRNRASLAQHEKHRCCAACTMVSFDILTTPEDVHCGDSLEINVSGTEISLLWNSSCWGLSQQRLELYSLDEDSPCREESRCQRRYKCHCAYSLRWNRFHPASTEELKISHLPCRAHFAAHGS